MYHDKDCVEKFPERNDDKIKQLYPLFLQQPITELTDVLKREHEAAEKCHICLKSLLRLSGKVIMTQKKEG